MHPWIVLWSHHVVIVRPILNLFQMFLENHRLLDWFSYLLDHSSKVRNIQMGLLNLLDNFSILGFWDESDVLRLFFDILPKELFEECVVLVVIFAVCNWKSVVPAAGMNPFLQLSWLLLFLDLVYDAVTGNLGIFLDVCFIVTIFTSLSVHMLALALCKGMLYIIIVLSKDCRWCSLWPGWQFAFFHFKISSVLFLISTQLLF